MDEHRGRSLVIVTALIVGAVALALVLTGWMRGGSTGTAGSTGPPTDAPKAVNGMAVISVSDALKVQAADSGAETAVTGWYQAPGPVSCPAPQGPTVGLLDGDCTIGMTWLMQDPESLIHIARDPSGGSFSGRPPAGAAVNPAFDGPLTNWAIPLPVNGDSVPTAVVFVGHFDDVRAAGCAPADRQACLDRFVVTTVAWANGVANP